MFTGIIEAVGEIAALEPSGGDMRLRVRSHGLPLEGVQLGDSIATSGVCLTVTDLPGDGYWADVSGETLTCTSLGTLALGAKVNLERALTPSTRLGGHLVSGHVDGVGEVVSRTDDARSIRFSLAAPANLAKYIAAKGSICVDGVSLTVNSVTGAVFDLNIVPHTLAQTTLHEFHAGRKVNLEVDIIARYLERLLLGEQAAQAEVSGIDMAFLAENGFLQR